MSTEPQVVKIAEIMHQGVVHKFQIKLIATGQMPPPPPLEQTIDPLKIVKVVTSGGSEHDILEDNDHKWSCKGKTCTATFDLGGTQQVGEIFIRFSKDAERTAAFEISLSDDGTNWLVKLTGEQQDQGGVILAINPFIDAKYVRFVGQGNNVDDSNSVEFVKISGKKLTEPQEPKSEPPSQTETKAISDTKQVAEFAPDSKDRKDAKETLKKSKKN